MKKQENQIENDKHSKKENKEKSIVDFGFIAKLSLVAFIISLSFSFLGETIIPNVHIAISFVLLIFFILLGILFDVIGVSVTVADIKVFNSMAAKKVKGASLAVKLIKNSDKVSSFLNDVIGDICGIVSGSTGATIAILTSKQFNINLLLVTLIMTAVVSTLTIGGKAIGKSIAINKCDAILYRFVKLLSIFYRG